MASTRNPLTDFILTPQQQSLLFAALYSNKPTSSPANSALNMPLSNFEASPAQGLNGDAGFLDSPLLDYDYDFNNPDSSLDFSFENGNENSRMIGDLPGASVRAKSDSLSEQDSPDKRSHPDDEEEENGAKRRESEDKVTKKPGRKPLTTEPTSKRKAQNRAAQRAFRERKEKHLKDLETKVQELEKASEASNHENEQLKQKIEKMTIELNEYKKRVTILASSRPPFLANGNARPFGHPLNSNISDVNFQFEFPKFGVLPGPPVSTNTSAKSSTSVPALKRSSTDRSSDKSRSPGNSSSYSQIGLDSQTKEELASFSANLFNPLVPGINGANGSRSSVDSRPATTTSSPSASSNSNMGGASSSCGTSPEPFTQSPTAFKPLDTLTTIGEESATLYGNQDIAQISNMNDPNWLPQNFQFDPQLFGDYREPQDNILSNAGFDDSFFNDALDIDFTTPYNMPLTTNAGNTKKPGLIEQIDAAKNTDALDSNGNLLTCNKIWEKLQNCPKVQNGDFDLDGLCSELQKKAKCSGSGAVVDERDFKDAMKKYLCSTDEDIARCEEKDKLRRELEGQKALGKKA